MKTKFCQYAIEEPLTSEQMKWRRNHPDWISDHFYMGRLLWRRAWTIRRHWKRSVQSEIWLENYWSRFGSMRIVLWGCISPVGIVVKN